MRPHYHYRGHLWSGIQRFSGKDKSYHTALSHIKHSVEAKDTFNDRYPDGVTGIEGPEDGWYGGTASRFRLGLAGATRLGNHLRLQVGFGGLINMQKQDVLIGFSFTAGLGTTQKKLGVFPWLKSGFKS